jgi:phosphoenolpyruvate synthase/pyruvate phosphate dikinase
MFGRNIGAGLRALNPGLARGTIHTPKNLEGIESFDREGIYLLPETVSDLPPVSGIFTQGEGSSLSHVQLLARNLGIPNVVVTESLLAELRSHSGKRAVLAVSPGGVVQLSGDGPQWDATFGSGKAADSGIEIRPDLEKLDLDTTGILEISKLRATDSGRSSGPKGANLGELKFYFGEQVPDGVVIPFGTFRKVLDQPLEPGGPKVFDWMKQSYEEIAKLDSRPEAQKKEVSAFLARLRTWITNVDIGEDFRNSLRSTLEQKFGPDGSYGVFVRSDTNVEDLAGFTGAGLNLTVFNVVGFDNILAAIHDVWASPFTERAYGWRQGNMSDPAYVFPAVVIQVAFPSEKSGVMVTTDVDQGAPGWLSIAVSEGVGGAVDGQATESLRVDSKTGRVQFLAQATAPQRTVLLSTGGIGMARASGTAAVLKREEIDKLIAFAAGVSKFPSLRDEQGNELPADIEFGFKNGTLAMLQIRPFVESAAAQQNLYLQQLDAGLGEREKAMVDIDGMPGSAAP